MCVASGSDAAELQTLAEALGSQCSGASLFTLAPPEASASSSFKAVAPLFQSADLQAVQAL